MRGCGGLVVRCRPRSWMVPLSKPDSAEDPLGLLHAKSYVGCQKTSGVERWCQLRCRLRHMTVAQNYEVSNKAVLALLKNHRLG
ncbi:hypothetical protein AVEN_31831-1 [Araneus ventricosus]|uniref:Uncharacterized protein n=1 Tax=Araneus ventricosus TaxID=182803 RepID=A0A4Y2DRF8_ARAVE|nr:hypothetical protein AVEN_31831-1 [Araneus ventricosus]